MTDRDHAKLLAKMSEARSHLGPALRACFYAHDHDEARNPFGREGCDCTGCEIRKSIELALGDLET